MKPEYKGQSPNYTIIRDRDHKHTRHSKQTTIKAHTHITLALQQFVTQTFQKIRKRTRHNTPSINSTSVDEIKFTTTGATMSKTSSMGKATPLTSSTTEQMLEKILSEINFLRVNVGILADENIKRFREIATIGRKAGMKGEIVTDYEGILTSDKEDASVNIQNLPDTKPEEREGGNQTEPTHTLTNDQEGADRSVNSSGRGNVPEPANTVRGERATKQSKEGNLCELSHTRKRELTIAERRERGSYSASEEDNLYQPKRIRGGEPVRREGWNKKETKSMTIFPLVTLSELLSLLMGKTMPELRNSSEKFKELGSIAVNQICCWILYSQKKFNNKPREQFAPTKSTPIRICMKVYGKI